MERRKRGRGGGGRREEGGLEGKVGGEMRSEIKGVGKWRRERKEEERRVVRGEIGRRRRGENERMRGEKGGEGTFFMR